MKRALGILVLCLAVLAAAAASVSTAQRATVPTSNLLQDPGAEAAVPKDNGYTVVPIPGWTTDSGFTALPYGSPGMPSVSVAAAWGGGSTCFGGGPNNGLSHARQTVDVSAYAADIDTGKVPVTLSAALGGFEDQGDNGIVTAYFRNAPGGTTLATLKIGPVSASDRGYVTKLIPRSGSGAVPVGTRSIEVVLTSTRSYGAYNDGYFDNISLSFTGKVVGGSPFGLWKRVNGNLYRFDSIKGGLEEHSMTPHRLSNRCLIALQEPVYHYYSLGNDLYREVARLWGPKAGGAGKTGLNCRTSWESGTAVGTVKIAVSSTKMAISCTNNVTRTCRTYTRVAK